MPRCDHQGGRGIGGREDALPDPQNRARAHLAREIETSDAEGLQGRATRDPAVSVDQLGG